MSTASEVDFRTPFDDPRVAAELAKISRLRRGDLLIMAARQLAMLAEAAKKIDRLQDETRRAGWARDAALKAASEAVDGQSRATSDADFARRTTRIVRHILFPTPDTSRRWMPADAGEHEHRQRDDRRDAAYLRGVIDAAVTLIDGAPSA